MAMGREILGYENREKILHARVIPNGAGAPSLAASSSKGIASVARSNQGVLLITLDRPFKRWLGGDAQVVPSADNANFVNIVANSPANGTVTLHTKQLQVTNPLPANGTPITAALVDLANTEELDVMIVVSDSDV